MPRRRPAVVRATPTMIAGREQPGGRLRARPRRTAQIPSSEPDHHSIGPMTAHIGLPDMALPPSTPIPCRKKTAAEDDQQGRDDQHGVLHGAALLSAWCCRFRPGPAGALHRWWHGPRSSERRCDDGRPALRPDWRFSATSRAGSPSAGIAGGSPTPKRSPWCGSGRHGRRAAASNIRYTAAEQHRHQIDLQSPRAVRGPSPAAPSAAPITWTFLPPAAAAAILTPPRATPPVTNVKVPLVIASSAWGRWVRTKQGAGNGYVPPDVHADVEGAPAQHDGADRGRHLGCYGGVPRILRVGEEPAVQQFTADAQRVVRHRCPARQRTRRPTCSCPPPLCSSGLPGVFATVPEG